MHRSGTSFLARCLNISGVYLGKNLILSDGSAIGNPKGFWEDKDFTLLSEKFMAENNGSWEQIPSNLKCSETLNQQFKSKVDKLVSESYISAGVKDPRLLVILDSILDVFPKNKMSVGIFSHPLKVAESLKIQNNFNYEKSLAMWQDYNSKLLEYIIDNNGFLFDFDWPKEKLLDEISLLVKKVGLLETNLNLVYSKDLFRSDKSYSSSYKIPAEIEETYKKLKERSMQNNTVKPIPITFSMDESRKIMTRMLEIINEYTEVKKGDSSSENTIKNEKRVRKILKKYFKI